MNKMELGKLSFEKLEELQKAIAEIKEEKEKEKSLEEVPKMKEKIKKILSLKVFEGLLWLEGSEGYSCPFVVNNDESLSVVLYVDFLWGEGVWLRPEATIKGKLKKIFDLYEFDFFENYNLTLYDNGDEIKKISSKIFNIMKHMEKISDFFELIDDIEENFNILDKLVSEYLKPQPAKSVDITRFNKLYRRINEND